MTVGDNELLVSHFVANDLDEAGIGDPAYLMQNSIFIADFNPVFHISGRGRERSVHLASGIAVQHKELAEVGSRRAQELQTVCLRFGEGLLVAMDDSGCVIFNLAQRDEASALEFGSAAPGVRNVECIGIGIARGPAGKRPAGANRERTQRRECKHFPLCGRSVAACQV